MATDLHPSRLAIIVTSDVIGGHEMQLVHLARAMANDHAVTLVVTSPIAEQFFARHGFDVRLARFVSPGKIWRQWHAARRLKDVLEPTVSDCDAFMVSGGSIEACVAPARALKLLRPEASISAYIPMYIDRSIVFGAIGVVYNFASNIFIGSIDQFITINRIQARMIARHYGRPVRVIRNVITPIAAPAADHGPRLIFVGRLDDHQKNLRGAITLLDHPDNPFDTLHLYGSGPDQAAIEAHARSARHLSVVFHGWASHERLSRELGRGDILLMNSRFEGEPMIVRELAAAGIPTVGTDIPGFRGILPRRLRFRDQPGLLAILRRLHAERITALTGKGGS